MRSPQAAKFDLVGVIPLAFSTGLREARKRRLARNRVFIGEFIQDTKSEVCDAFRPCLQLLDRQPEQIGRNVADLFQVRTMRVHPRGLGAFEFLDRLANFVTPRVQRVTRQLAVRVDFTRQRFEIVDHALAGVVERGLTARDPIGERLDFIALRRVRQVALTLHEIVYRHANSLEQWPNRDLVIARKSGHGANAARNFDQRDVCAFSLAHDCCSWSGGDGNAAKWVGLNLPNPV